MPECRVVRIGGGKCHDEQKDQSKRRGSDVALVRSDRRSSVIVGLRLVIQSIARWGFIQTTNEQRDFRHQKMSSEFYPQLGLHYARAIDEWYEAHLAELATE
jgi:hypothetical protein